MDNVMWTNYSIIVMVGEERAGFIIVDGKNFIITDDIQKASKFDSCDHLAESCLKRCRDMMKCNRFVLSRVPRVIFGGSPSRVVSEEV